MRVLITRPRESATSLADQLKKLGHQVLIDPLIEIIPLPLALHSQLPPLSSFEAIVTTSQQAIRCLSTLTPLRDFPLWCVGSESAKVARDLGFLTIYTAEGSAEDLIIKLTKIIEPSCEKTLLHASGDVTRVDIVEALSKKGISAERVILYKTTEASAFSPETFQALKLNTIDAVLFYSPRTGLIFQNLCRHFKLEHYCKTVTAICLSDSIKMAIQDLPWDKIRIAKKTTTDDLLMALMMAE
ncbi:MAG: uroporphyrinogen-III synthase [Candidatus Paracaedibacter sp.]